MIDNATEAHFHIKGTATVSVLRGMLFIQSKGGSKVELGEVTQEKLNELMAAFNNLNQHLFPKARFDVNEFLASQK
jgi:hypothetical protein